MGRAAIYAPILVLAAGSLCAQRVRFQPQDLQTWQTDSEARISPDGKTVAFVRSSGGGRANLYLASADGRTRRALTDGDWKDWSPRWAADAPEGAQRLSYLSDRGGRIDVRVYDLASQRDAPISGIGETPLAAAISPNGAAVAFTATTPGAGPKPAWAPPALLRYLVEAPAHAQLFVAPISGGPARRLTAGDLDWKGEPAWMPDGQSILCAASAGTDVEHPMQGGAIFTIRVADGAMTELTEPRGDDSAPAPSPDGSRIAWLSTGGLKQSYAVRRVVVANRDGSRARELTGSFDRDAFRPQWSSDSRTVYFLAEDAGAAQVYAARNDGTVRMVTRGKARLADFSLADNGRAAAIRSSATEAGDLITFAIDLPGGVTTVDAPNEHLLAERQIGAVEEFAYDSAGRSIQAWLVKPPDFDATKKYPMILVPKDAPRAMHGYEFHVRAQTLAAAGFVVMLANPRGSPGYGEEFGSLLPTRNPGDDADDLKRGVDAAIGKGFVDPKRVMVEGGLVAAWLLSHSAQFASAVLRDPVADRAAEIAASADPVRRAFAELGGFPWQDPAAYWQHSPIYFAGAIRTPTLIVARKGSAQARELYVALEAQKVDAALIELPEQGVGAADLLEAEIGWFRR